MPDYLKILPIAALGLFALAAVPTAASADTVAQCQQIFADADEDDNGVLSRSEIVDGDDIPDELENRSEVTLDEFVAVCRDE